MKLQKLLGVSSLLLFLPLAQARYGQGGWIFGGIGAGGVMVNSSEPSDINVNENESDKLGYSVHLKSGLSWYMSSMFVADFMVGFVYSQVKGDAPATGGESVTIKHQVGIFQISPRFRFGDLGRWQIGPLYKLHFGTDTGYREFEGQTAGEEPMTHYLGLHLNYDMPSETEKTIYRFGLEALTDMSDPRGIYMANVLFEIGFNLWDGGTTYEDKKEADTYPEEAADNQPAIQEDLPEGEDELLPENNDQAEVARDPEPVAEVADPDAITASAVGNTVLIKFPGDRFQFATGMSHIGSRETREYVRELGEFMARNDSYWQKAVIVGHTDKRGPKGRARAVNMELSEARARTVYNAFSAAGMNASKMRYEGRAFDEPVPGAPDNAAGWKLNRRVEVTFEGVSAPDKIIDQINALNKKFGYGNSKVERE